jgi:regulatory protein
MASQSRITAVEEKPGGFRVTVSDLPDPLFLPIELVYRYSLKPGVVITPPQLSSLVEESERFLCDRETARLLALREHSAGELRLKLRRKGFAEKVVSTVVAKYTSHGLIDDARLATALARRAHERKPSGRSFLIALLRKKLIERTTAEQAVDMLLEGTENLESAVRALRQRWPVTAEIEVESVRSKAYSYLSRRGFGYETARAAFLEVFGASGKADDD